MYVFKIIYNIVLKLYRIFKKCTNKFALPPFQHLCDFKIKPSYTDNCFFISALHWWLEWFPPRKKCVCVCVCVYIYIYIYWWVVIVIYNCIKPAIIIVYICIYWWVVTIIYNYVSLSCYEDYIGYLWVSLHDRFDSPSIYK